MATIQSRADAPPAVRSAGGEQPTSRIGHRLALVGFYVLLVAIAIVFIGPYLLSVSASFKSLAEVNSSHAWSLPSSPGLGNFRTIFSQYDFGEYLLNTVIVTVILTLGQVVFSLMGAYAFARLHFPGRDTLFWVYLGTLMVPNVVTIIPLYVIMSKAGLLDTYWAIFLPYTLGTPYTVFLMRQYLLTLPEEMIEAARLDGCSDVKILTRIIVPVARPIIFTATIIAIVFSWNNFLWPLIATNSNNLQVLTVGIANFNSNFGQQWNLVIAGSLIALIPMVALFIVFQKYIINSIQLAGVNR